jgi:hypothetical protein
MAAANDVLKLIKDDDVKFADFRFSTRAASGSTSLSTSA